ncbi:MAG: hypothetical protein ACUVTD_05565 [Nitrososphaerales archaeon]
MDYRYIIDEEYVQKFGQYLRDLITLLSAYEVVDRISKARDLSDFSDGVKVAGRLSASLQREAKRQNRSINVLAPKEIKNLYNIAERVYSENPKFFRFFLNFLTSLAFAYGG